MLETWLRRQRFGDAHTGAAFDHRFDAVLNATAARDRLDEQIIGIAASPRFMDTVGGWFIVTRLACRGCGETRVVRYSCCWGRGA